MLSGSTADRLPGVPLAEVEAIADLQIRTDRKYIIDADLLDRLIDALADDVAILDIDGRRQFTYESVYFDTPELDLYHATAYRRRRRYKVRTRTYQDSGQSMLEVKTKDGRGRTVKHRLEYDGNDHRRLTAGARAFIGDVTGRAEASDGLAPVLITGYQRSTLVHPASSTRATVDGDIVCADLTGGRVEIERLVLETKSRQGASPVDRYLWRLGVRPVKFSKCCTAQAMIDPSLPSNRWHRTIHRDLADARTVRSDQSD